MSQTAQAVKKNASWTTNSFWWVDTMTNDVEAAKEYYSDVFGWEWENGGTTEMPYWMATLSGKNVAGLGEQSAEMSSQGVPPMWNSYILVDSVDATIKKIEAAGGTIVMPAMDVMDIGRMAFCFDVNGAEFGLWEAKSFSGADAVNQPGTFIWTNLWTTEPEKALKFYGDVFGWQFNEDEMMGMPYWMITLDGETPIGGIAGNPMAGKIPNHWSVTFGVNDIEKTVDKISAAGGNVQSGPGEMGTGVGARATDPTGAFAEYLQLNEWPS